MLHSCSPIFGPKLLCTFRNKLKCGIDTDDLRFLSYIHHLLCECGLKQKSVSHPIYTYYILYNYTAYRVRFGVNDEIARYYKYYLVLINITPGTINIIRFLISTSPGTLHSTRFCLILLQVY